MNNRINVLVILAVIIFTLGAKYIVPYESELKAYGFLGMALIIIFLSAIAIFFEYIFHKLYLKFKGKT
jgi:NADH:ubiquinone oxidoreductase subunit 3 (subunit A)